MAELLYTALTFNKNIRINRTRGGGGGGAHVKILTGMLALFFGFEIWSNPIFLGWQIF